MPTEGRCLCGDVHYRATAEPTAKTLCHCQSCRRATGGVSVGWVVFPTEAFAKLSGDIVEYESSPGIHWGHCVRCGSLVTYRRASRPQHMDVTTATLDDPDAFAPTVEIWTGEKIAWEALNPSLPHKLRSSLNE